MSNGPSLFDRAYAALLPGRAARSARALHQLEAAKVMRRALAAVDGNSGTAPSASLGGEGGYDTVRDTSGWVGNWSHGLRDAAGDTLPGLRTLRGQARDLTRTNAIAAGAIGTNVLRAVGTGLALSAQPHRAVLGWSEQQAADWVGQYVHPDWRMWADSPLCDYRGVSTFDEIVALACRSMLDSGDAFSLLPDAEPSPLMPYRLRVQLLEADRVGNPRNDADTEGVAGGIRFKAGRPVEAFIYNRHPGAVLHSARGALFDGQWVAFTGARSGRRRLLHHFRMLRPEQPRGVPYLAPVMGLFRQLGVYSDAEIKAAIVSAFHTVFITSDAGASPAPVYDGATAATGGAAQGAGPDEIALGPAAIIGLRKGEAVTTHAPGRPNPQFGPFVQAVLDQLGAGTFLGSEMLLKKYNTSYVAARAAFLDAWKWLLDLRMTMVRSLCQPVYETFLAEGVASGRIPAPGFFADPRLRWAYTRATWNGDSQGSINPKDEVAAYTAAIDAKLLTRERAEWELFGTPWSDTYDTKKAEHQRLAADGMLPPPKAGAAAPAPGAQPAPEPADDDSSDDGTPEGRSA